MKTTKTAAGATLGLYVAVLGLLTAVLPSLGALLRLSATGLQVLTDGLRQPPARVPAPAQAPAEAPARPNLRIVPRRGPPLRRYARAAHRDRKSRRGHQGGAQGP